MMEETPKDNTAAKRGIVDELHRQARKNFPRRKTYVKGLYDLWEIDLVEMKPYARVNGGMKYILTVIDVLSKHAWAVPVRTKTGKDVTSAMLEVFAQTRPRKPKNIHSDRGKEFYNEHFQKLMQSGKINHYSTYSHIKAPVVERFNRTLKTLMWREFGVQGDYKWVSILPQLLQKYNTSIHRTIGMRPIDVRKKHEKELMKKINSSSSSSKTKAVVKFKPGDTVRVSKFKALFAKGYTPSWSTELFTVNSVRNTVPPVYYLSDKEGTPIKGGFYSFELQKTKYPDTYLVEKVLKRKGDKTYVKWLGFDNRHNSWI